MPEMSEYERISLRNSVVQLASVVLTMRDPTDEKLDATIALIGESLAAVGTGVKPEPIEPEHPKATDEQIAASITPSAIFCFENGKPYRSLRRHLTALSLTPDQYRAKWGLPPDYPMVAADYAAKRSTLAKAQGLGKT